MTYEKNYSSSLGPNQIDFMPTLGYDSVYWDNITFYLNLSIECYDNRILEYYNRMNEMVKQ